ncbi:MAG: MauE/DoxX family redox-associated membrane protein [Calditrichaceae bacterium]|jgi:uncharacterized membrane protein YphA (DoxX/SURF4 family)
MNPKYSTILSIIFRLIIGSVFVFAAIDKILDPYTFAADIRNYQILPDIFSNILALILPWIEFFCGMFLIIGLYTRSSALMIASMLVVFIFAISLAMIRGLNIDCGCYHSIGNSNKIGFKKLIEDLIYFIMASYLFLALSLGPSIDRFLKKRTTK